MSEFYRVRVINCGDEYLYPWGVEKETMKAEVVGAKNDEYKTKEEALEEAIRFLKSCLKSEEG